MNAFYIIALAVLTLTFTLVADKHGKARLSALFKIATSSLLLAYAVSVLHDHSNPFALLIVLGISCDVIGDALLTRKSKAGFLSGMACFLCGHWVYLVAFWLLSPNLWVIIVSFLALLLLSMAAFYWLYRDINTGLRWPIGFYLVSLSGMSAFALAASVACASPVMGLGAILFVISDGFVARQRFKQPHWINRALGLPLYYSGQFLIASSILIITQ